LQISPVLDKMMQLEIWFNMKHITVILPLLGISFGAALWAQGGDPNYKPRRFNKAIELLEDGQPIYNANARGGDGYDVGVKLASTYNDFIIYEMEDGEFNIPALRQFMSGLSKSGPTKSGHRMPAVIVTLPVVGYDETSVRANVWMIQQVLAAGVMGIELCHARSPEAVKMLMAASRYPIERANIQKNDLQEGLRGAGSEGFASQIWGMSSKQYRELADPWPLNPKGELMMALKIEDKYALANAEKVAAVPGVAFAEWGPGDMGLSLGFADNHNPPYPPAMAAARKRVMDANKAAHIGFLETVTMASIEALFKEGTNVTHGSSLELVNKGRKLTDRQMPW
jgi:4-hydroxy-2-oxoheptanedioate aldolase